MKTKLFVAFMGVVMAMTAKGQFAFVEPSKKIVPAYLRTVRENVS